jgi:hypothetical protein
LIGKEKTDIYQRVTETIVTADNGEAIYGTLYGFGVDGIMDTLKQMPQWEWAALASRNDWILPNLQPAA